MFQSVEPVIAKKTVESKNIRVDAGRVAGLKQKAKGITRNREVMNLDFQRALDLKLPIFSTASTDKQ